LAETRYEKNRNNFVNTMQKNLSKIPYRYQKRKDLSVSWLIKNSVSQYLLQVFPTVFNRKLSVCLYGT